MHHPFYVRFLLCILSSIILLETSCTTLGPAGIFGKKSPHEDYADKIKNAGLSETALGREWFTAAEQSLAHPLSVIIPYKETGYFPANEPKAAAITFHAKRGEKLTIDLSKKPVSGFALYLDFWQVAETTDSKPKFLLYGDTLSATTTYDVDKDGSYILRLQPELLKGGEYTLSISTGPSLAFPVTPKVKSSIGSFWGAGRDAGVRKHEGIDIFAPRGTALVAAADGVVTRVEENRLGGKVIFLAPDNKDYSLYYAHLEKQIAQPGQRVKIGDTLGLMGNTGNAITTVPHLHFGIYTFAGAVDPLPFVNREIKMPEKITASVINVDKWVRNSKITTLYNEPDANADRALVIDLNTLLKVEAATLHWYKVTLPGGEKGFVQANTVTPATIPIRKMDLKYSQPFYDAPTALAARKAIAEAGKSVNILAEYKGFYYINYDKVEGWIPKKSF